MMVSRHSGAGYRASLRCGCLLLGLLLGIGAARGDSTNFVGDFRAAFWTALPEDGSITFTNSDTALVLAGPEAPTSAKTSLDAILYNGELGQGLAVGGIVEFSWQYDSGDALSSSEADFAWQLPGGVTPVANVLAQGGPGTVRSGFFQTPVLQAGTTFEFLLSTETPANKLSGTLTITDFQFHAEVPEPSTGLLLIGFLAGLRSCCWRRARRV